mmetsp:Transcript_28897/g.60427  ORF Transcript_28897/g.60427 Transcript_28897/m.60427 type:complete len:109 (+) Transcript_28897:517-843(+)
MTPRKWKMFHFNSRLARLFRNTEKARHAMALRKDVTPREFSKGNCAYYLAGFLSNRKQGFLADGLGFYPAIFSCRTQQERLMSAWEFQSVQDVTFPENCFSRSLCYCL